MEAKFRNIIKWLTIAMAAALSEVFTVELSRHGEMIIVVAVLVLVVLILVVLRK
jgi:hypothetical protein